MSKVDRIIEHVVDRDSMHRLIDELSEDSLAVLVVRNGACMNYWYAGNEPMLWDLTGLLSTLEAKLHFEHNARTHHCPGDE